MQIIPTIELQSGRCVSLRKGRLDDAEIWHVDPVEAAHGFAEAGASLMRITDFDAVMGSDENAALVEQIIRTVHIPVQLAGGLRSRDRIEKWIDRGAGQIVIGTMATQSPDMVKTLAKYHPDQIVLSLDVWQGKLMTDGWRNVSAFEPAEFLASFGETPLAGVIVTDIDSDLDDMDAQLGLITGLAAGSRLPVIASGTVSTLDDIARLKYVPNVAGTLVGRALFRKQVDLGEALALAGEKREKVADFQ